MVVDLFGRKPPLVPDPGQQVRLRMRHGQWRGKYRAISGPISGEGGEVMVRVSSEQEYREARQQGRRAGGELWPVKQIELIHESSGEKIRQGVVGLSESDPRSSSWHRGVWRSRLARLLLGS